MILLTHPTGSQFVRHALLAFEKAGILGGFRTCISWDESFAINRFLPERLRLELARRAFPEEIKIKTHTYPYREAGRLLAAKIGLEILTRHEKGFFSVDRVYRLFDLWVADHVRKKAGLTAVYCYEDGALETFKAAKARGIKCIYELPIGYWRAARCILGEEAALNPGWAVTLTGNTDSDEKLARKDAELKLADMVIVPSLFVKDTLDKFYPGKIGCKVIPYGGPESLLRRKSRDHKSPLKVLYVGSLSQRKGISYLFDAIKKLEGTAKLTMIGMVPTFRGECKALNEAIKEHRWIDSMPHAKILEEMRVHDVLVLPSLFEGFALVILEAMSCGLPVVTTKNSGAEGIVKDGDDGFIVPIRSSEAISEKLKVLDNDRDLLVRMSFSAVEKAGKCSWEKYRRELAGIVSDFLGDKA